MCKGLSSWGRNRWRRFTVIYEKRPALCTCHYAQYCTALCECRMLVSSGVERWKPSCAELKSFYDAHLLLDSPDHHLAVALMMAHCTGTQLEQSLASLGKSIIDKPPYISGTLQLPESYFSLFYKVAKDGHAARHINLANATSDELEQLTQACEPTSFGKKHEDVFDETYRKAGKMDSESFSLVLDPCRTDLINIIRGYLLEGTQSTKNIKAELYKMNIYGRGSFFKPHVDTPRSEKMFGSLVIVFPSRHEGGALLLRHHGHEWNFDSGQALAGKGHQSIGYVAFFSDIEHEVAPVTSGHRITLTYNLYFDDGGPVSTNTNDAVSEHLNAPQPPNQGAFRETFTALLENPEFVADGGALAFGLRHVYPIDDDITHVYSVLKGSDAVVYQSVRALGYEPVLYLYYESYQDEGMIINKVIRFDGMSVEDEDTMDIVYREGGIFVNDGGVASHGSDQFGTPEPMHWVTPVTQFNTRKEAYTAYLGNEQGLSWTYGNVCLVVRIGKAGDRLAYTTVAELNKAYQERRDEHGYW